MRQDFHVTTKAALYSDDGQQIVVTDYLDRGQFGLPGGHIDKGEHPDQAMARELEEETGLKNVTLQRRDFFLHVNGKLVLAYVGTLPLDTTFSDRDTDGTSRARWMTKAEFGQVDIEPGYRKFALENWPQ